ncbi:DUF262 domain-containing protein [Brevundimonas sp.]|uniref:DUF262 domain-containing protein n=1 Tax=Brevundimonas sp. TaxID=1871086 RepID=UPI0028A82AE8|nr:DUF262 domain-containing protein [Brevundimonas sp.]
MADERTLQENLDLIQQKARERTVKTQTVEYDLETLAKRIDRKSIKLDPDYQRRHRWTRETSSRLIESLILNIPIPVVFISQDVDVDDEISEDSSRYTVIDGQQRLTAIHDFLRNRFPLEGLETLPELNGAYYKSLPSFLVRRLEERTVRCMRIDSTVDAQIKFDIFERLNTGSVKLEAQELRNATARGPFNELVKELAQTHYFRDLIQVDVNRPDDSPKVQKMEDAELVLRFFALSHGRYRGFRKGFKEFLTASQVEFNSLPEDQLQEWKEEFETYMKFLHVRGGPAPFAKWRLADGNEKRMSSFNAAVFDALAIGLAETFTVTQIENDADLVEAKIRQVRALFADPDFFASVSGSVNDAAKVMHRINAVAALLQQ